MPPPPSLFSLSLLLATLSIILLAIELLSDRKTDYVIDRKRLKSVGILLGVIYIALMMAQILTA